MNETTKIRPLVMNYCSGCGVDLGCGAEKIRREAIGIDSGLDEIYHKQCEERDLSCVNIKRKVADLDFFGENTRFDYVYTSHFLEHLEDPIRMICSIVRVLKPGGYFVIYLPDRVKYTEPNPEHFNMWTLDEFIDILPKELNIIEAGYHENYSFYVVAQKPGER